MQKVKQLIFAGLGIGGCVCIILASVFKIFPFVFILLAAVMFVGVVILGITILLDNQRDTPSSR